MKRNCTGKNFAGTDCQRATKLMIANQLLSVDSATKDITLFNIMINQNQQIIKHLQKPL